MKLMKHITIALVLCAIPAMAFGQTVSCDDCTHEVSVYMGGGGLIATADDADMVSYVATCGGSSRFDELAANDDGVVSMLFEPCLSEGGSFKIGPIMDGGWYWITDDMNSAVGNLVAMDILDNDTVDITDAGDSVDMTMGKGAVYLKHTASGRVGILPNILPEPPATPLRKCGFSGAATAASPAVPVNTGCALGDGGTILLMTSTNAVTGASVRIMDKGSVTRPGGTASVVIVADLWGNGSGHYVTTHDATTLNGISAMLGQDSVAMSAARAGTRLTGVTYAVSLGTGGPGAGTTIDADGDGTGDAGGVSWTEATNAATISVGANSAFCSKTANHTATVNITALMTTDTDADQVVPSIKRATSGTVGRVGSASFMVNCPAASANQGQELVPENPFPTE